MALKLAVLLLVALLGLTLASTPISFGGAAFVAQRNSPALNAPGNLQALYAFSQSDCAGGNTFANLVASAAYTESINTQATGTYLAGIAGAQLSKACPIAVVGGTTFQNARNGIRLSGTRDTEPTLNGGVATDGDLSVLNQAGGGLTGFTIEMWFTAEFNSNSLITNSSVNGAIDDSSEIMLFEVGREIDVTELGTGGSFTWQVCDDFKLRIFIQNGQLRATVCRASGGGGSNANSFNDVTVEEGKTHHVAVVFPVGGAAIVSYFDGVELDFGFNPDGFQNEVFVNGNAMYIGTSPATLDESSLVAPVSFMGDINMVAIYDTALSDTQVGNLFGAGPANSAPVAIDFTDSTLQEDIEKDIDLTENGVFFYDDDLVTRPGVETVQFRLADSPLPSKGTIELDDILYTSGTVLGDVISYNQGTDDQFSPAANDNFGFQIIDGDSQLSTVETYSVLINAANDLPVPVNTVVDVGEGAIIRVELEYTDVDCADNNNCASAPFPESSTFVPAFATFESLTRTEGPFISGVFGEVYEYNITSGECTDNVLPNSATVLPSGAGRPTFFVCYSANEQDSLSADFEVARDDIGYKISDGVGESLTSGRTQMRVTNVLAVGGNAQGTQSIELQVDEDTTTSFQLTGFDNKCDGFAVPPAGCASRLKTFQIIALPLGSTLEHDGNTITTVPYPPNVDCTPSTPTGCIQAGDSVTIIPNQNYANLVAYPQCFKSGGGNLPRCTIKQNGIESLLDGVGNEVIPCSGTLCPAFSMEDMNNVTIGSCGGLGQYLGGCPERITYQMFVNSGASPVSEANEFPGTVVWFRAQNDAHDIGRSGGTIVASTSIKVDIDNITISSPDGDNEILELEMRLVKNGAGDGLDFGSLTFGTVNGEIFQDGRPCVFDCSNLVDSKQFAMATDCSSGCSSNTLRGITSALQGAMDVLQYQHTDSSDVGKDENILLTLKKRDLSSLPLSTDRSTTIIINNGLEGTFVPPNTALGEAQVIAIIAAASAVVLMCLCSVLRCIRRAGGSLNRNVKSICVRAGCLGKGDERIAQMIAEEENRDIKNMIDNDFKEIESRNWWGKIEESFIKCFCGCCFDFSNEAPPVSPYKRTYDMATELERRLREEESVRGNSHEYMLDWEVEYRLEGPNKDKVKYYCNEKTGEETTERPRLQDGGRLLDDSIFYWKVHINEMDGVKYYYNVQTQESVWHLPELNLDLESRRRSLKIVAENKKKLKAEKKKKKKKGKKSKAKPPPKRPPPKPTDGGKGTKRFNATPPPPKV